MSNLTLLRERIEQNYTEFKDDVRELDTVSIYELASLIDATEDVYSYTSTHNFVGEEEAANLLQYNDPLLMLSYVWKEYREASHGDIGEIISEFIKGSLCGHGNSSQGAFE
ncbi:MAG: hypothetical protein FWE20_09645 [Defluviitaleaceae bacterium]|nr:hypothetical protein [Defluviitaleaceae bacterium]